MVSQKHIRSLVKTRSAYDITNKTDNELISLYNYEDGFETVKYSKGKYGINGLVLQGNRTGYWYAITRKNSNLFIR